MCPIVMANTDTGRVSHPLLMPGRMLSVRMRSGRVHRPTVVGLVARVVETGRCCWVVMSGFGGQRGGDAVVSGESEGGKGEEKEGGSNGLERGHCDDVLLARV